MKRTARPKPLPPEKTEPTAEATPPETTTPPQPVDNPPEKTVGPETSTELKPENEAQEKARYDALRKKAMSDAQVSELKEKLDVASSDTEQRAASKEYYRALFNKMRKLDGSQKDRINRMEAATQRRINRRPPPEQ